MTLCVVEDFRMPIAAYTLDGKKKKTINMTAFKSAYIHFFVSDGFDVTEIRILEPPGTRKEKSQQVDIAIVSASTNVPADMMMKEETKAIQVSRKRAFEEDNSQEVEQPPPRKKARMMMIDVHALVFPELYNDHQSLKKNSQPQVPNTLEEEEEEVVVEEEEEEAVDIQVPHRFTIFPKSSRNTGRAIKQRFQSQIRQTVLVDNPGNDIS